MSDFASSLLRPDNHDLYAHVRLMAVARNPVLSWEEIASEVGLDEDEVPALLAWFLSYRLPPIPHRRVVPEGKALPRDPADRAEYLRLQDREASLLTAVTEAPVALAAVQLKMGALERRKPLPPGGRFL